jgi:hypothetical protein
MSALNWLTCPLCGTITDTPHITRAPHASGAGFHIRARCPSCGNHIKFLSKSLFTQAQIVDLRCEGGDNAGAQT